MMRTRGFSMVGMLLAVAIMCILAAIFLTGNPFGKGESNRPDGVGQTVIGSSAARARDAVCIQQLAQARQALQMASIDDVYPPSIEGLQAYGLTPGMMRCPIGPEEYEYDPLEGKVTCPHPGHETY